MGRKSKASDFTDRFRKTALGSAARQPEAAPQPVPETPAGGRGGDASGGAAAGAAGDRYGGRRKGRPGRKARVPLEEGTGRHRLTLELDGRQYDFLRRLAFEHRTDVSALMRALIAFAEDDEFLRRDVAEYATRGSRPPGLG
ncbi:MAG: hypothetical protein M3157_05180 [Actinomycetota bacterium]|nr:hypothetical protein [Actinomycetota bacterium]